MSRDADMGRMATTPQGDVVCAQQDSPTSPWRVWLAEAPDRVRSDRWLFAAVKGLLDVPDGRPEAWFTELIRGLQGIDTPLGLRFACPCCDFLTLDEPTSGSSQTCPVCWWEDDLQQYEHPDLRGRANRPSLNEARSCYFRYGVKELRVPALPSGFPVPAEFPPDRADEIPPIRLAVGLVAGTTFPREFIDGEDLPGHGSIDRVTTLPDGRAIHAVRPTSTHSWTVQFAERPETAWSGRWLLAVLRRLLELDDDDWPAWQYRALEELCGFGTPDGPRFECPCCDLLTLRGAPTGTYLTCRVCGWEDDPAQHAHPDAPRWPQPSLREARANYRVLGASRADVTPGTPRAYELPQE